MICSDFLRRTIPIASRLFTHSSSEADLVTSFNSTLSLVAQFVTFSMLSAPPRASIIDSAKLPFDVAAASPAAVPFSAFFSYLYSFLVISLTSFPPLPGVFISNLMIRYLKIR